MDHPPDTTSLLHHFAALKDLRQRVKVIYPLPAAAPMARWNASTPSWAPQSSHRATSRSCRCRRNSSPHRTARRSRTASATPPSAGWPGTATRSRICGRSFSATTYSPASRSPPPSSRMAATLVRVAAQASPASRHRTRPTPNTCMAPNWRSTARPSAKAASAPPPIYR
jgi:hypothetical protein